MAKSYDEVDKIRQPLEEAYMDRHDAHRKLRQFWHGRYWADLEQETGGVSSIFKDLTARQTDVGPDIKLVYNTLKDVCVKFQTFLSPLPMIRCYVDPPSSPTRRNQASKKERYLYGMWAANSMNQVLADHGWYLPLMGDVFLGIFPDMEKNMCRTLTRSPEVAFPIPGYDSACNDGYIFAWKARESAVKRAFPDYTPRSPASGRFPMVGRRKPRPADPEVEILEYSDKHEFARFVDTQRVNGVEHDLGFDLFDHIKFINVPGEVWGHGAVEQAVNLVEMGNAYLSLMMQSAIENVFPMMVLEDPMKAPETIEKGAGAVIPVNAGGKVYYVSPPSQGLLAQTDWAHEIERMVKQDTSMPDVNFGNFNASIVTGKAINELQGAGTGTLVEMVQGVGIGSGLVNWNEKAIQMGRTMFHDDTIYLYGTETPSLATVNPRHFSDKIKGSQLVGSTRNEVVFMPYLDMHTKVVVGLQLAGGGLVSKAWQRENVGIPDSEAMEEEIVSETIQDAVLALLVQQITTPDQAEGVENQATSYIEGRPTFGPPMPPGASMPGTGGAPVSPPAAGAPPIPGGPPPGGGGGGGPAIGPIPGGTGEVQAPPLNLPPGSPVPEAAQPTTPPPQQPSQQGYPLYEVQQQLQNVQGVTGRVFLVGQIVATGVTQDTIEVDVTEASDRDVIRSQVDLPMTFHVITGEPNEQFVEVTPGTTPVPSGQEPQPEELLQ